jgi:hypothetical protein
MGYDIHITRRQDWADPGNDITKDEFVRLVRSDAEFHYPGQNGNDYADWQSPTSDYTSWLCWSNGQIYTKNPEEELIDKMVALARTLQAEVQGDDGEVYESATKTKSDEIQEIAQVVASTPPGGTILKWPLWKQLIAAFLLGCLLLAIKLIILGR